MDRTVRALAGWSLAAILFTLGCDAGGTAQMIDWDFSKSHRVADIGWEDPDVTAGQVESVASVQIRLPEGRRFVAGDEVHDIIYSRDEDVLDDVTVSFDRQSAEDAFQRAMALVEAWGLDGKNIEEWFAEVKGKTGAAAADVDVSGAFAAIFGDTPDVGRMGPNGPAITVQVVYSFDDMEPWIVTFQLSWNQDA